MSRRWQGGDGDVGHVQVQGARFRGRGEKNHNPSPQFTLIHPANTGSKNLPFMELTTSSFQSHAPASSVEPLFSSLGVSLSSPDQKIVLSCGSGVTACYLAFALNAQLGVDPSRISVYDGSWSEWGKESNGMPIEK